MSVPTSSLGIHLAPATAAWAAPFAAYYLFLQNRIIFQRFASKTGLGHQSNGTKGSQDPLYIAFRAQSNFNENVPLTLVVSLLAELNGVPRKYINYALGTLFVLRVVHVELGLNKAKGLGIGRGIGALGTQIVLATLSCLATYSVKDYWL